MNERIKELIAESDNGQFHNGKCYPHIGSRTLEDWDKFAKLIVQECLTITGKYSADALEEELKAHFGVE